MWECGNGTFAPGTVNSKIATEPFESVDSIRNLIEYLPTRMISSLGYSWRLRAPWRNRSSEISEPLECRRSEPCQGEKLDDAMEFYSSQGKGEKLLEMMK